MSFNHNNIIQDLKNQIDNLQNNINNNDNKYQNLSTKKYICSYQKQIARYNNNKLLIKGFKINNKFYISQKEYILHIQKYEYAHNGVPIVSVYQTFLKNNFGGNPGLRLPNINRDGSDHILINYNNKQFYVYEAVTLSYYLLNYNKISDNQNDLLLAIGCNMQNPDDICNFKNALKFLNLYFEFKIIDYKHDSIKQSEIINNLESKFDKKFNDLFENISEIIKELKKDLDVKNEKIRNLELEVHYLKSQSEKKVTIDYDAIKQKNKLLNNEFKRIYKLMKFSNE